MLSIRTFISQKFHPFLSDLFIRNDHQFSYDSCKICYQILQEDFVQTRQANPSRMTADDFHMHLLVARLMALSFGCASLTREMWDKVKVMENLRKARLPTPSNQ